MRRNERANDQPKRPRVTPARLHPIRDLASAIAAVGAAALGIAALVGGGTSGMHGSLAVPSSPAAIEMAAGGVASGSIRVGTPAPERHSAPILPILIPPAAARVANQRFDVSAAAFARAGDATARVALQRFIAGIDAAPTGVPASAAPTTALASDPHAVSRAPGGPQAPAQTSRAGATPPHQKSGGETSGAKAAVSAKGAPAKDSRSAATSETTVTSHKAETKADKVEKNDKSDKAEKAVKNDKTDASDKKAKDNNPGDDARGPH